MNKKSKKSKLSGISKTVVKAQTRNGSKNGDETESKYFSGPDKPDLVSTSIPNDLSVAEQLLSLAHDLNVELNTLKFSPPVKVVYNPTEYAIDSYRNYIHTYGNRQKTILFLGMNPGPWGMSQTGVPFGEVNAVKNWLKITGTIGKPPIEDPARPVTGFNCPRSEVSGKRFWELAKHVSGTPDTFFKDCLVYNYCPLQLIGTGGKNITPTELKAAERDALNKYCDATLIKVVSLLNSKILIGIGQFAVTKFNKLVKDYNLEDIQVYGIPHPSPRAAGNTDWQNKALKQLEALNLVSHFK